MVSVISAPENSAAEVERQDGDHRDHGVAQRVAQDTRALARPLARAVRM